MAAFLQMLCAVSVETRLPAAAWRLPQTLSSSGKFLCLQGPQSSL